MRHVLVRCHVIGILYRIIIFTVSFTCLWPSREYPKNIRQSVHIMTPTIIQLPSSSNSAPSFLSDLFSKF